MKKIKPIKPTGNILKNELWVDTYQTCFFTMCQSVYVNNIGDY